MTTTTNTTGQTSRTEHHESSPRFTAHTPTTATGRARDALTQLWDRHGDNLSAMTRTMAGSPSLLEGYLDLSRAMKRTTLSRRLSEQISLSIQQQLDCAMCLAAHTSAARAVGLSDDDIALARAGTATDPAAAALIAYANQVHQAPATVTSQQIEQLRRLGHTDRQLLDVVGLVALNHLTGAFNLVAGFHPEQEILIMNSQPTNEPSRNFGARTKLAAYGALLAASFAAAAGVAVAVGPIDTSGGSHNEPEAASEHDMGGGRPHVPGISIDADGFRIVPATSSLASDAAATYSFRIVSADGDTVTDFDVTHERKLHLIVVSRNFVDYHHLHPTQSTDGAWAADIPALPAGSYRVFADTRPTGADAITLGTDLVVGDGVAHSDGAVASPAGETTVTVDGYEIELSGTPAVGESTLTFSVQGDGEAIVPDPYLGASGHLVALRTGDLAFLHVHPLGDATPQAPDIRFAAEFPTPGTYRLFLDVSIDGAVRTAAFTVDVPETASRPGQHDNDNHAPAVTPQTHETGH